MIRRYPAVFLLAIVVPAIVGADWYRPPAELMVLLALVSAVTGAWLVSRHGYLAGLVLALSLGFFAAGHFALRYYDFGPSHVQSSLPNQRAMQYYGEVDDWPVFKSWGTEIKVQLDSVRIGDSIQSTAGGVLIKLSDTTTALQYGDRVVFDGKLYRAREGGWPGGFDYSRYLNLQGVHGVVYLSHLNDVLVDRSSRNALFALADDLRFWITQVFYRYLTPEAAALASGFLIGETRNIPPDVYQWFRDSGTLHLLAVSGSNVALVILFFVVLLRPFRLPRRVRSLILLAVIFLFALICYAEPSVIRASIMACLVIVAGVIERRYDLNQIIAVAALAVLLTDPGQLYSVGFQLSFVAAWGLILTVPRLDMVFKRYRRRRWYYWLIMPMLITLTAQLFAGPVLAYYFNTVPLISPLANLIVVPMVSLSVVGCLVLLATDAIWSLAAVWVGKLLDLVLQGVLFVVARFGDENIPAIEIGSVTPAWSIIALGLIVLAAFALNSSRARRSLVLAGLVLVNAALLMSVIDSWRPSPRYQFCIFRAAGGLGVIARSGESSSADLYLEGLRHRRFLVDERLLEPALHDLGIDRLHRLMVRRVDYGTLGGILRTARRFDSDSLIVSPYLRASVIDANRLGGAGWDESGLTVMPWDGRMTESCATGIHLGEDGVLFRIPALSLGVNRLSHRGDKCADSPKLILIKPYLDAGDVRNLSSLEENRLRAVFSNTGTPVESLSRRGGRQFEYFPLESAGGYLISTYENTSDPVRITRLD